MLPTAKIEWQVRPATPEDGRAVGSLLQKSYEQLLPRNYEASLLSRALPLITTANDELLTCGTWYVVVHPDTERIVGCGGWTRESPTSSKDPTDNKGTGNPHLRHFACDPDLTRCGIASAIWNRSLVDMEASLDEIPSLEVFSTLTAVPFYEHFGFVKVKTVEVPLQQGACMFPAVLMQREKEMN